VGVIPRRDAVGVIPRRDAVGVIPPPFQKGVCTKTFQREISLQEKKSRRKFDLKFVMQPGYLIARKEKPLGI
jgi:hypothetical protein